jgi:signal transduction histidine kinase
MQMSKVSRGVPSRAPVILWLATLGLLTATMILAVRNGSFSEDALFIPIAVVVLTGYTTVGAVIASRFPRNPVGWLFMLAGMAFLLNGFASEYVTYTFETSPGSLPLGRAAALVADYSIFFAVVPIPLLFLLFPTGTLPSPRWRPLAWAVAGFFGLGLVADGVRTRMLDAGSARIPNPLAIEGVQRFLDPVLTVAAFGAIGATLASAAALFVRFRRAQGEERQQIRWLAYGAVVAAFFFLGLLATGIGLGPEETSLANEISFLLFFLTVGLGIPVAAAVAMFRYRLYDLDIVIKKTLVFAILAVSITAVGLLTIALMGALLVGPISDHPVVLGAVGIAIGLLVTPLRRLAVRVADRVVYGGRATPYEVLTDFSGRMAETYSADDVVPRMAAVLGAGIGAEQVVVWLRVGRELRPAGLWPAGPAPGAKVMPSDELPHFASQHAVEVRHQGELLGALSVEMPVSYPMNPATARLVQDLAGQAGLVLRNVRLIEELRASRQRLVKAQDDGRRAIERNIHDGAQQQLVALAVKLRLADAMVDKDPAKAHDLMGQIQQETSRALQDLRDLARGIYPPLLADKGLAAAVEAQARKSPVPVAVEADGIGRFPQEIEAAVYFCVLEGLQNALKHANPTLTTVRLAATDGHLTFQIADDGRGFDTGAAEFGTGLQGMADRLDAIGGTLEVTSEPGLGTTVTGRLPVSATT